MEEVKNETSGKKKKFKKSSIAGYIVSILCLLLCLYITIEVISANVNNRPPKLFGVSVSYVPTGSMEPTITTGSYIMFTSVDTDDIKTGDGTALENHESCSGDIIIYYNEEEAKYIVHRVVEIGTDEEGKYFIFWGDNNLIADETKVRENMIFGKYVTTLGFMAIFSGGINTNLIFFILVGIFIIMIAMQVVQIFLKSKTDDIKKKQEKDKELLREEMKRQILTEEIERLKAEKAQMESDKALESQVSLEPVHEEEKTDDSGKAETEEKKEEE